MLVIPKILEYAEEPSGSIAYGVGLCFALFFTECLKALSMCSCWVVSQRTGTRFRTAVSSFAFEKLIQFKSLTHITMGEVSAWGCQTPLPRQPREGEEGARGEGRKRKEIIPRLHVDNYQQVPLGSKRQVSINPGRGHLY